MGSLVEAYVDESGNPLLERLRSQSQELQWPETPELGWCPPEAAALREQPSSTVSQGGVPERESASAFYGLGCGGTGQTSSPPHPTMGEARRRRFGDRGSVPWEDPYSHLLGTPVEPSAGNFLQTIGAHHQELHQQEVFAIQGSRPLCPGQGQVHRDSEPRVEDIFMYLPLSKWCVLEQYLLGCPTLSFCCRHWLCQHQSLTAHSPRDKKRRSQLRRRMLSVPTKSVGLVISWGTKRYIALSQLMNPWSPWGCLSWGDPNGGVSWSLWTGSSCQGTCLFFFGDILTRTEEDQSWEEQA